MNPEPHPRELRLDCEDAPEGIDYETWLIFCQEATRYDMPPTTHPRKTLVTAWNPWGARP